MAQEDSKDPSKSKKRRKTDDAAADDALRRETKTKHKKRKTQLENGDVTEGKQADGGNGEDRVNGEIKKKKKKDKDKIRSERKEAGVVNEDGAEREQPLEGSQKHDTLKKTLPHNVKKKDSKDKSEKAKVNGDTSSKPSVTKSNFNRTEGQAVEDNRQLLGQAKTQSLDTAIAEKKLKKQTASKPKAKTKAPETEAEKAAYKETVHQRVKQMYDSGNVESSPPKKKKKDVSQANGIKPSQTNGTHATLSKSVNVDDDEPESDDEDESQAQIGVHVQTLPPKPTADALPGLDHLAMLDLPLKLLPNSPTGLHQITASMYLPVPAVAVRYPVDGSVSNSVTPLLLRYYPPFRGFILGFGNVRAGKAGEAVADPLARIVDQYASSFMWLTIDFTIFRPNEGTFLEGEVTIHAPGHLSLVVWNFFTASVERKRLPRGWTWVAEDPDDVVEVTGPEFTGEGGPGDGDGDETVVHEAERKRRRRTRMLKEGQLGAWHDADGKRVEGTLVFRARDFDITFSKDAEVGMLSIEGSLVSGERDAEIDDDAEASNRV